MPGSMALSLEVTRRRTPPKVIEVEREAAPERRTPALAILRANGLVGHDRLADPVFPVMVHVFFLQPRSPKVVPVL